MPTRKQLRDQIKSKVAEVYGGQIFTSRVAQPADGVNEFVNVFIPRGEIQSDGMGAAWVLQCAVTYSKVNAEDDDLDAVGDLIAAALDEYLILPGASLQLEQFQYSDDEESALQRLSLIFSLVYY